MTDWSCLAIHRVIDGDTVDLTRTRLLGVLDGLRLTATDDTPVRIRLVHVDTPERGQPGYAAARDHLYDWLRAHPHPTVAVAGRDRYGRLLADLRDDDDTASLHLMRDKGWPPWRP